MGGGQLMHVIAFPIGRLVPMEAGPIPGGDALFREADGVPRKTIF